MMCLRTPELTVERCHLLHAAKQCVNSEAYQQPSKWDNSFLLYLPHC